MKFEKYPFEKLTQLLEDIVPNEKLEPISLTIGEPQFPTPKFIQDELIENITLLNKYPKSAGEDYLKNAQINFIKTRFGVDLEQNQIIPTFGTREVLFNFPQFYLSKFQNPVMAYTNPFYQIYEGAAIASNAKIILIDLKIENNFQPIISDDELKSCDLVILNYPNNPTSAVISKEDLAKWVQKALDFDFVLINDECYSELFFDENNPPSSILEACETINPTFKNILAINSISKRSSAPGLRSGFIAGDAIILKDYLQYRTYIGCAVPLPLQKAAAIAWNDENHTKEFRKIYQKNFELAKEILNIEIPNATFYLWLKVDNELEFTQNLYKEQNVKVLPGSFLGRSGAGKGYIRIALVENEIKTREALNRIKKFLG
jgi:aspartate/methionine/tyrosine aminotransferase